MPDRRRQGTRPALVSSGLTNWLRRPRSLGDRTHEMTVSVPATTMGVRFQFMQKNGLAAVPDVWIHESQCYWPNYISRKRAEKAAVDAELPTRTWKLYDYKQLGIFRKCQDFDFKIRFRF